MQPYQEAGEETHRQRARPFQAATSIASHAMPFLNTYIPLKLAVKGLNKIDPRLGKFMDEATRLGYGIDQIKNFIRGKVNPEQQNQEDQQPNQAITQQPAKDERNIIQKYSPELHNFIDEEIRRGRRPIEAGAMAQYNKEFAHIIKMLSKEHKTPWSKIIESIYGTGETAQPSQAQQSQDRQEQIDPMLQKVFDTGANIMKKYRGG